MELKNRKYIKNTGELPKFQDGFTNNNQQTTSVSKWQNGDYAGLVGGVANLANNAYNQFQYTGDTSNDYLNKYGTSNMSINGINYAKYNDIDINSELDKIKQENRVNTTSNTLTGTAMGAAAGLALGTIVPGIGNLAGTIGGAVIGGLTSLFSGIFGGKSKERQAEKEMKQAQDYANKVNSTNRSNALTDYLQQQQYLKYGDPNSQTLFAYKRGKNAVDPTTGETINNYVVETAGGKRYGKQNSWVSKGEGIWNPITGYTNYITHGKNDTARAYLEDSDVVFGNKRNPATGNKFKDDAAPLILQKQKTGDQSIDEELGVLASLQQQVSNDKQQRDMKKMISKNLPGYKCGKGLKKYDSGITPWGNIFSSAATGLAGLSQYLQAKNDTPYQPNTYIANPYLNRGLTTLAGLNVNPYPVIQQLRDAEARTNYAVNVSGGLSTAQKHLARIASLSGTQQNIAKLLSDVQQQNNTYKAQYANAALQYGDREATNQMTAKRYDLDYYSKSHAARQQGMQTGIQNMVSALQSYYKNYEKAKQYNETMNLYRDQNQLDRDKFNAMMNNNSTKSTPQNTQAVQNITAPSYFTPNQYDLLGLANPHVNPKNWWKYWKPNLKLNAKLD